MTRKTILIIGIFASIGILGYLYQQNNRQEVLQSIIINDESFQSTGALPFDDKTRLSNEEIFKLFDIKEISTPNFKILAPGNGTLEVYLSQPYDKNKNTFINWLTTSDYSHIDPAVFTYIEIDNQ